MTLKNDASFDLSKGTVPLYSILGALVIIVGGISWLTSVAADARSAKSDTAEIKATMQARQDIYLQEIRGLREDVVEIKTILKLKQKEK